MPAADAKVSLRKRMRGLLGGLGPEEGRALGRRAGERIRALPEYAGSRVLLVFLAMPGEISTESLVDAALAEGKLVAAPRMEHSVELGDQLVFVPLSPDHRSWPRDRFGIPEPPADAVPLSAEEIGAAAVLVVVPGLAFDRGGGRLGRGKGYYDRFLAAARAAAARLGGSLFACGLCFGAQIVESVPADGEDQPLDAVITEDDMFRTHGGA